MGNTGGKSPKKPLNNIPKGETQPATRSSAASRPVPAAPRYVPAVPIHPTRTTAVPAYVDRSPIYPARTADAPRPLAAYFPAAGVAASPSAGVPPVNYPAAIRTPAASLSSGSSQASGGSNVSHARPALPDALLTARQAARSAVTSSSSSGASGSAAPLTADHLVHRNGSQGPRTTGAAAAAVPGTSRASNPLVFPNLPESVYENIGSMLSGGLQDIQDMMQANPELFQLISGSVVAPGDFKFLTPDYANSNIVIQGSEKLVSRRTVVDCSIVFFNQQLAAGQKLAVKVVSKGGGTSSHGFAFGLTTCDTASVMRNECHAVSTCQPTNSCRGRCMIVEVRNCRRSGDSFVFEWKRHALHVTGPANFQRYDRERVFAGNRKAYPFIVLSGYVTSLKIIPEEEAAAHQPYSAVNPFTANFDTILSSTGAGIPALRGRWISNESCAFRSFVLTRIKCPGYIFRNSPLDVGKPISIQIMEITGMTNGTMTIGVTSKDPVTIQVMNLSVYPAMMNMTGSETWKSHTLNEPLNTKLSIVRTFSKVQVRIQERVGTGERVINAFDLEQSAKVYPFFCFNGDIRSIQLLNNNMEPITTDRAANVRTAGAAKRKPIQVSKTAAIAEKAAKSDAAQNECCICMDETRVIMCDPCHHVVYCEGCKQEAERQGTRTCPMCRTYVTSFVRIYL